MKKLRIPSQEIDKLNSGKLALITNKTKVLLTLVCLPLRYPDMNEIDEQKKQKNRKYILLRVMSSDR